MIPTLLEKDGAHFRDMLKASEEKFKIAKHQFLSQFETQLKVAMVDLYTPGKNLRRDKEIDRRLFLNKLDPDAMGGGLENLVHSFT